MRSEHKETRLDTNSAAWNRCFKKRLFWTADEAKTHMLRLWSQEGANGLEVYPCEIGNHGRHFHVGHRPHDPNRHNKLKRLRTVGRGTVLTEDAS
jgi:hypothetical protein